eukprot:6473971-Amphidinium_carterae.4
MHAGRRRVLIQGAVNSPVSATHGMPPWVWTCRISYTPLSSRVKTLQRLQQSEGRQVTVRKYVDDMV